MRFHRRSAPRVVGGRVQRKNRWTHGPDWTPTHQVRIERYKPDEGFQHFVSPTDITAFLNLLPQWRELSIGLQRVVLSTDMSCLGWHRPGTVAICPWEEYCTVVLYPEYYDEHASILGRLGVPCRSVVMQKTVLGWSEDRLCLACGERIEANSKGYQLIGEPDVLCDDCGDVTPETHKDRFGNSVGWGTIGYLAEFTPATIQAFLLVHVLVHELGHHHDRMTSPKRRDCTRGERFAEEYAQRHEAEIWAKYQKVFKW